MCFSLYFSSVKHSTKHYKLNHAITRMYQYVTALRLLQVVSMVLATDIALHFEKLTKLATRMDSAAWLTNDEDRKLLLCIILHTSFARTSLGEGPVVQ